MSDKPGRNAPCPCGSGKKYKICCLVGRTHSPGSRRSRFRMEPGSYGGGRSFMPAIICYDQSRGDRVHFVLVKPLVFFDDEDRASAVAARDQETAFASADPHSPDDGVAMHLRGAGYVIVNDPQMASLSILEP